MSTTAFGSADSFKPGSAGFSSGFGAAGFGFPSGKAVLNLPVRRIASEYSVPLALKLLAISPPANEAVLASTNWERFDDLIRTVFVSPSAGMPEKAPQNAMSKLSAWAETT